MASNASKTRDRLLEAAAEVFAKKGFRDATVADICERAGANIAAVNYHFQGKENLYVEAWRDAFEKGLRKYPPHGGVDSSAPPEERLRGRITALLKRFLDPDTVEFDIIHRELGDPTGLLLEAPRRAIEPLRRETFKLVQELLGEKAGTGQVLLGVLTVMGPLIHIAHRIRHGVGRNGRSPNGPARLAMRNPDSLIDHTVRFLLAGIREMREGINRGLWPDLELPDEFVEKRSEFAED